MFPGELILYGFLIFVIYIYVKRFIEYITDLIKKKKSDFHKNDADYDKYDDPFYIEED